LRREEIIRGREKEGGVEAQNIKESVKVIEK
jgi:hypothetical protein